MLFNKFPLSSKLFDSELAKFSDNIATQHVIRKGYLLLKTKNLWAAAGNVQAKRKNTKKYAKGTEVPKKCHASSTVLPLKPLKFPWMNLPSSLYLKGRTKEKRQLWTELLSS